MNGNVDKTLGAVAFSNEEIMVTSSSYSLDKYDNRFYKIKWIFIGRLELICRVESDSAGRTFFVKCSFFSYWTSFCLRLVLSSALVDGISNRIGFLSAVTWTMGNKIVLCDHQKYKKKVKTSENRKKIHRKSSIVHTRRQYGGR